MVSLRIAVVPLVILVVFSLGNTVAYGCSCAPPPDPIEAAQQATSVFLGELLEYEETPSTVTMVFRVVVLIKGALTKKLRVETASSTAACGLPITKVGGTLLIYAGGTSDRLTLSLCSRTIAVENPTTEVELLKQHFGIDG